MVKKLFKHEALSYVRMSIPMYSVLLGVALLGRFVQFFESDTDIYSIVFGSSIFAYVAAIIVTLVLTLVFVVTRFYRHLFTGEGYLTFTLPVTTAQHIRTKALTALVFQIVTCVVAVLSFAVFTAGEVCVEVFKAAGYLIGVASDEFGGHFVFYGLEVILLVLTALLSTYLLFYACIAIGQMARKNRVLAAVGVYFGYYLMTQVLGTLLIVLVTTFYEALPIDEIVQFTEAHPYASAHIGFAVMIVFYAGLSALYFAITHALLKNKLNLE